MKFLLFSISVASALVYLVMHESPAGAPTSSSSASSAIPTPHRTNDRAMPNVEATIDIKPRVTHEVAMEPASEARGEPPKATREENAVPPSTEPSGQRDRRRQLDRLIDDMELFAADRL